MEQSPIPGPDTLEQIASGEMLVKTLTERIIALDAAIAFLEQPTSPPTSLSFPPSISQEDASIQQLQALPTDPLVRQQLLKKIGQELAGEVVTESNPATQPQIRAREAWQTIRHFLHEPKVGYNPQFSDTTFNLLVAQYAELGRQTLVIKNLCLALSNPDSTQESSPDSSPLYSEKFYQHFIHEVSPSNRVQLRPLYQESEEEQKGNQIYNLTTTQEFAHFPDLLQSNFQAFSPENSQVKDYLSAIKQIVEQAQKTHTPLTIALEYDERELVVTITGQHTRVPLRTLPGLLFSPHPSESSFPPHLHDYMWAANQTRITTQPEGAEPHFSLQLQLHLP